MTVTGYVLYDFWTGAIGRELEPGSALALFENVSGSPAQAIVGTVTLLGLVGPLVLYAGLDVDALLPLPFAAFAVFGAVPAVVIGLRMIQRNRSEATV